MPNLTHKEVQDAIICREPAAELLRFHASNLDRLWAERRLNPILNEKGRAIAFMKSEILGMLDGSYRKRAWERAKPRKKTVKKEAAK